MRNPLLKTHLALLDAQMTGGTVDAAMVKNQIALLRTFLKSKSRCPRGIRGKGIIICGGGDKYLPGAWIGIKRLRALKCALPIQLWHLGRKELPVQVQEQIEKMGVKCIDALEVRKKYPSRILNGYELKSYALLHTTFKEILLLDADNVPISNPEYLFSLRSYKDYGAIAWPRSHNAPSIHAWTVFDIPYRAERGFDTAQLLINKAKVCHVLRLANWYNQYSDFYYRYIDGEKETFHMAFRKLNVPYVMIDIPPVITKTVVYQHDNDGNRLFQHRYGDKWKLYGPNHPVAGFQSEKECFRHLDQLQYLLSKNNRTKTRHRKTKCILRCPLDGYTGYGLHAQQIINHFTKNGYFINVLPIRIDEPDAAPIPHEIKEHIGKYSYGKWEILLHPPDIAPTYGKRTIFFTMWESTRLSAHQVENLKRADILVVPCEWNANTFSAQGIDAPIEICPLGIDETIFYQRNPNPSDLCIFGAAGNSHISGRTRKGLDDVIKAFKIAFPRQKDVRLEVKILPGSQLIDFRDPRINVTEAYLTQHQLAEWYSSLTCFVSAAKAEAWGLMQHQAMAVGRPVIACDYGGLREFFDASVGYPTEYTLTSPEGRYAGLGLWAQPQMDSLVDQMQKVYKNRPKAAWIGTLAAKRAHLFTWQKSNRRLLAIVRKYVS